MPDEFLRNLEMHVHRRLRWERSGVPHAHQLEPDDCVAPPNRPVAARSVNICEYFGNLDDAGGVRAHVLSDWPAQSCRNLLTQRCRAALCATASATVAG